MRSENADQQRKRTATMNFGTQQSGAIPLHRNSVTRKLTDSVRPSAGWTADCLQPIPAYQIRNLLSMAQCKAKSKRTHERCAANAMIVREECYHHGGKTPRGIASPNFKHGRYSKSLPARMRERYEEALADPHL